VCAVLCLRHPPPAVVQLQVHKQVEVAARDEVAAEEAPHQPPATPQAVQGSVDAGVLVWWGACERQLNASTEAQQDTV
jgi:hypothetical protein